MSAEGGEEGDEKRNVLRFEKKDQNRFLMKSIIESIHCRQPKKKGLPIGSPLGL